MITVDNTLPPIYQLIIEYLLPQDTVSVLDLGCGTGVAGEVFNKEKRYQFFGVDLYGPYLKICKQRGFYKKVIKADLRKINFKEKSFDVVILFQVIEHLNGKDSKELIKRAIKIAKKAVLISVPNGDCRQEAYDGNIYHKHKSSWTPFDLKNLGFKVYGQGLKILYGSESYVGGKQANLLQKIVVPLATILLPLIIIFPKIAVQLIAVKYTDKEI